MSRRSAKLLIFSASLALAACGGASEETAKRNPLDLVNIETVAAQLPPEAKAVVTSYERDLRAAAAAHMEQFGRWPTSLAELTSVAAMRENAVNLLADGLGEQIPFASRETLEKAATGLVSAAETRILDQMRTPDAANP